MKKDVEVFGVDRVAAIVLRLMRRPILVLIAVATVTVFGMVMVPGPVVDGEVTHMSFFHALYFLTYTATTTGFGEIPYEFSDAQRLWAMISLYGSVISWVYAIGSIIALLQNPHFKQAVAQIQFARNVQRISDPFFIVCGFGDTGSLVTRGLSDNGLMAVVIDSDSNRIQALSLRDYTVTVPGLCADAGIPKHLIAAGLTMPNCEAVVAITNDEGINRKIIVMARLLNPKVRAICRSSSPAHEEFLASLGSVFLVNPFETFAQQLSTALRAPLLHTVQEWMAGARGVSLDNPVRPPTGKWILCGFGRMGRHLREALTASDIPTAVIDPGLGNGLPLEGGIVGNANARTLRQAGIHQAVGIVAATNSDSYNLGILLNARVLSPRIFALVRQNRHDDEVAFQAAHVDLIMQPSLVTARRILFLLVSPMVQEVFEHLQRGGDEVIRDTVRKLKNAVGDDVPENWTVKIPDPDSEPRNAFKALDYAVTVQDLVRDPANRERSIGCVPLAVKRRGQHYILPRKSHRLVPGDRILMCGTRQAKRVLNANMNDAFVLAYLATGSEPPHGYMMRWLARKLSRPAAPAAPPSAAARGADTRRRTA